MRKSVNAILLTVAALAAAGIAAEQSLPHEAAVPGGIARVALSRAERPRVYYGELRVMVIGEAWNWQAIVGIPLNAEAGSHELRVLPDQGKGVTAFQVVGHDYASQHLSIADKRHVNPTPEDMQRIDKESARMQAVKAEWTEDADIPFDLVLPVAGRISSPFGLRRYYNGEPRQPHGGIDIAAPEGTPVRAAARGRIIDSADYFFNGHTVLIDHGQGLMTLYCHLSRVDVAEGETVDAGSIIGAVGRTGRATAAHLHWSVYLNQTAVDPALFRPIVEDSRSPENPGEIEE